MKKMTSAYANKRLRQLNEDKELYLKKEEASCTYVAAVGEEPVIPDYDYFETASKIEAIDEQIQKIKHAINKSNVTHSIVVGGKEYSIDTILIRMAQLNRRKSVLDELRKELPKQRQDTSYFGNRSGVPEYKYINYDLEQIGAAYECISEEIMEMQMGLDQYNQTCEFEVDL